MAFSSAFTTVPSTATAADTTQSCINAATNNPPSSSTTTFTGSIGNDATATTSTVLSPPMLAQRWNEKGAYCMETGRYDRAIMNFVKAMEYCKKDRQKVACSCKDCTLESCVEYSHGLLLVAAATDPTPAMRHNTSLPSSICQNDDEPAFSTIHHRQAGEILLEGSSSTGIVYRKPIRTSPTSFGHSMGLLLPRIITFNLALAHHCKSIQHSSSSSSWYFVTKKLYQMVYKNEKQHYNDKGSFFMALVAANNLAHVHESLKNIPQQQNCLKFVISTVICFVQQQQENPPSSATSTIQEGTNSHHKRNREYYKLELQGFLQSAISLIYTPQCCAGAA